MALRGDNKFDIKMKNKYMSVMVQRGDKISNTLVFLFLNKLVYKAGIHLGLFGRQLVFERL